MVRWEAGARQRLQVAALELFASQGFEQTTATEIAGSVGLTERTFFRHFADKREVLFFGQEQFGQVFLDGIDAAPADATPFEVIACALTSAVAFFPDERRVYSRARQSVIAANPPLQERELHKLAALATTMAGALRERGFEDPAAVLAAESGVTVFGVSFSYWIRKGEERSLAVISSDMMRELSRVVGVVPKKL